MSLHCASLTRRADARCAAVEWRKHYTPSGRNTPPPGRWVPTGTEALKSGLNVGDAAEKYEEKLNVQDLTKY